MARHVDSNPMEITGCMKEHLIVLNTIKLVFCREYLYNCTYCLQVHFMKMLLIYGEDDADLKEFDEEIYKTEQIFDSIIVPSFVSLFTGSTIQPLYFVQITGKGIA